MSRKDNLADKPAFLERQLMAFGQDKCVGTLLLTTFTSSFAYFAFCLLVLPFVDDDSPIQNIFPHRAIAVILPAAFFTSVAFLLVFTLAWIFYQSEKIPSNVKNQ